MVLVWQARAACAAERGRLRAPGARHRNSATHRRHARRAAAGTSTPPYPLPKPHAGTAVAYSELLACGWMQNFREKDLCHTFMPASLLLLRTTSICPSAQVGHPNVHPLHTPYYLVFTRSVLKLSLCPLRPSSARLMCSGAWVASTAYCSVRPTRRGLASPPAGSRRPIATSQSRGRSRCCRSSCSRWEAAAITTTMAQGRAGPSEQARGEEREDTWRHGFRPIYVCKGRLCAPPPLPREAV